jgi:hypothetical protein
VATLWQLLLPHVPFVMPPSAGEPEAPAGAPDGLPCPCCVLAENTTSPATTAVMAIKTFFILLNVFLLIIGYNDNNYCCNTHIVFIHIHPIKQNHTALLNYATLYTIAISTALNFLKQTHNQPLTTMLILAANTYKL